MNIARIAQPGRLGQPWVREIVPGVFRVSTTFLGCYAVEDAGAYTFIVPVTRVSSGRPAAVVLSTSILVGVPTSSPRRRM